MAELLTPGVFIQEVDFGPQPIEGVSTSTAGFVGETERGSTSGRPVLVTSFPDFVRKFGSFVPGKHLPLAMRGFFDNGGRRAFVMRVLPGDAAAATVAVTQGYHVALLAAPTPAATAGNFILRVASVVGVNPGDATLNLVPTNGVGGNIGPLTVVSINSVSNSLEVSGGDPGDMADVKPATHALEYQGETAATTTIEFVAKDKGFFGNRVSVLLTPVYLASASVKAIVTSPNIFTVNQIAPFAVGQTIEIEAAADGTRQYLTITAILPALSQLTVGGTPTAPTAGDIVRVTGWKLDVFLDQSSVETITGISSNDAAADGVLALVNDRSQWVQVVPAADTPPPDGPVIAIGAAATAVFPFFANGRGVPLSGGTDSASSTAISASDVIGSDLNGIRTGLKAIEAQDGISIIAAPGFTGEDFQLVVDELIAQSERRFDRFAVFESNDEEDIQDVLEFRGNFNSKFGAMYHPWLLVLDPATKSIVKVPPSGHVIGGYARTDNDRGVFKAPANITIRGIQDFTHVVPDGEQDLLNPAGVNVLRRFTGLGPVIWGARTISAEGLWKYVPVRRLFIFIEQSLIRGTRFAVFEPNDQRLWARLHDGVTNFLTTQWRAGALFGAVPEEAFFVKVDETTTTQDDRDNGRVNIVVGIAPVKPAEFIVFQIGQAPNSVIISEQG